jgi:hypothetical protein
MLVVRLRHRSTLLRCAESLRRCWNDAETTSA